MENASKALLIAGAVLIVILIIAVGMIIYNSSRGTIDEAVTQMSSQEVQMFNQQFTQYAGTRVSGSNVRALVERVNANNNVNNDVNSAKHITINDATGATAITGDDVDGYNFADSTAKFYSVTITNADGLVHLITIGN